MAADAQFLIEIIVRARRELAGVMDKAAKDVDKLTGAEERRAKTIKKVTDATKTNDAAVEKLTKQYHSYLKELEGGNRDTDVAISQLKRFGQEFDKLGKKADVGSEISDSLLKASKAAKDLATEVDKAAKARTKSETEAAQRIAREIDASYRQAEEIDKAYSDNVARRAKSRSTLVLELLKTVADDEAKRAKDRETIRKHEHEEEIRRSQARVDDARAVEDEIAATAGQSARAREAAEKSLGDARRKLQAEEIAAHGRTQLQAVQARHAQANLRQEIQDTTRAYDDFIDRVRAGEVTGSRVKTGLQQHVQALSGGTRKAVSSFGPGSPDALFIAGRHNEAKDLIRETGRESTIAAPRVSGFTNALTRLFSSDPDKLRRIDDTIEDLEANLNKASFGAIHFAGVLRSLVYVGAIVFFQELTSAAIALAGAMVAVASTAVQAGGALVGSLAAGAAQALPIIGLLGAAWGRVGAVFDAVKQNIKQQTTAGYDNAEAAKAQAAAADNLTAAQEALNEATRQAARDIADLQAAQRSAQLQAERSILSQSQAQVALTSALRSGDVGSAADLSLRVRESSNDANQSRTNLFRATADARTASARGVKGQPNVVAARRQLEQAKRAADEAVTSVSAADRALEQMLADLSPAERRLYEVLNRVVTKYRQVFTGEGGVLESITDAFTHGGERVLDLLEDSRLIGAARKLADAIADQLERVFDAVSGPGTRSFVADLADDARRNLPLFVSLAMKLSEIAGAIAKAGGPALTRFLDFFLTLATRGDQATGTDSGLDRLTKFFLKGEEYAEDITMLALAVGDLFGAITGSAAEEGQNAIEGITGAVRDATDYIRNNRGAVRKFFSDAVDAAAAIAKLGGAVAKGLFGLFRSDQVQTATDALRKTFIPALLDVLKVIGVVTQAFLKFAGTGPGSALIQFVIVTAGINKVLGPLVGLFGKLGLFMARAAQNEKLVALFSRLLIYLGPVGLAVAGIAAAMLLLNKRFHFIEAFRDLFTSSSDKAREAGDKLTKSIERTVEALRKQRDAALLLQGSRLAQARAEIAVESARRDAAKLGGIDPETGRIKKGVEVTDARRDASLNLKQALLDERQARIDLADAKKADDKSDQEAVDTSKKSVDAAKTRIDTLRTERTDIEKRIDAAKREVDIQKKLRDQQVPGSRDYKIAQEQLKDAQDKLKDAQTDLKTNFKNLRLEADRGKDAFSRWRNAVKRAGSNTTTFSDDVHSAMESVVSDVNEVLVEFGAKPIKFKSSRSKTKSTDSNVQIPFGVNDPGGISGFPGRQRGGVAPGIIPGSGDGDKVHVMAEPGEGFINKTATRALGGKRAIDAINSMIPRFQRGGIVQIPGPYGNGQGVDSRILNDVLKIITKYKALVTAGFATSGHKAAGEHPLGLAVDLQPGKGGSWDLIDKLAKWAEPSQNNPRSPFRWVGYNGDSGHGRGNHLHLSWLHDGLKAVTNLKGLAGSAFDVAKRTITGPTGALKDLFQGASNKVVDAANKFLAKKTSVSDSGSSDPGDTFALGDGSAGQRIFDYWIGRGFTDNQAAAWVGNFVQESGLDPRAKQPGGPGRGLAQWGDSRFAALQSFAKARNTTWEDEQTQLDFAWHELQTTERGAYRAIKRAKTLADAVAAIGQKYERFGIEGNRLGPAEQALRDYGAPKDHVRGGGHFAAGGEVEGPVGKAVNIVAHAKEWVLNQGQQSRLARLAGTTVASLKSMLGFGGGPGSFKDGGEVKPYSISSELGLGSGESLAELGRAGKVIERLKSSLINSKFTDALSKSFQQLLGEGGLLDLVSASVTRLSDRLDASLQAVVFSVDKAGNVIRDLSPEKIADKTVINLRRVYETLNEQAFGINQELEKVRARLANPRLTKGERKFLESSETNLEGRLAEVNKAITQNVSDQFSAIETRIQTGIDAVNKRASTGQTLVGLSDRIADLMERGGNVAGAFARRGGNLATTRGILTTQRDALIGQANVAGAAGRRDIQEDIWVSINELNTQLEENTAAISDNTVAAIRAQADAADARAARDQTMLDIRGRAADLLERTGNTAGAFSARGQNLGLQRGILETQRAGLLAAANNAGAQGLIDVQTDLWIKINDLDQTLAENTVAVAENTTAARSAAITAITDRGGFLGGVFGGLVDIVQGLGGLAGVVDTAQIKGLLEQASAVLGQTGAGLAQKLFENFGIDLRGLNPQQITSALRNLDFDTIESGLRPDQKAQFEGLIDAIIENTTATIGNSKQIQDLTTPSAQGFSSTAWQMFRRAIFNGAGGLLPQFNVSVPSLSGGAYITRGGMANLHTGERVVAAEVDRSRGGDGIRDVNVYTTTPTVMYDPTDQARQMAQGFKNRIKR